MAVEMIEQPSATTNTTVVELSEIAISDTHGEDSPYFAGWKAYDEDPYDEFNNPSGVIQMGLAENQVSFDLLEKFLEKKSEAANVNGNSTISGFRENALFQDYHGLLSFRKVCLSASIYRHTHILKKESLTNYVTNLLVNESRQWLASWNKLEEEELNSTRRELS